MKTRDDGGQAFPRAGFFGTYRDGSSESEGSTDGMSIRDYFAGQALPGVIAARTALDVAGVGAGDISQESIAEECYELADAMLLERKQPASARRTE